MVGSKTGIEDGHASIRAAQRVIRTVRRRGGRNPLGQLNSDLGQTERFRPDQFRRNRVGADGQAGHTAGCPISRIRDRVAGNQLEQRSIVGQGSDWQLKGGVRCPGNSQSIPVPLERWLRDAAHASAEGGGKQFFHRLTLRLICDRNRNRHESARCDNDRRQARRFDQDVIHVELGPSTE